HRRSRNEEGRRDVLGGQTEDGLEDQRRATAGIDRRMRAGKHQGQSSVWDCVALVCHRFDLVDDQFDVLLSRRANLTLADEADLPPARRRQKPGVRVDRYAIHRPRAQSRRERVAESILGASDVACAGGEQRDQAPVALTRSALGGTVGVVHCRQPFWPVPASATGRISIDPYLLDGQRFAQTMASSRLGASTKKYPANCSFVSAYGPSSTSVLPSCCRTVVAAELGCNRTPAEEPSALASAWLKAP